MRYALLLTLLTPTLLAHPPARMMGPNLPPAYLFIEHWESCANTNTVGHAQHICLPIALPEGYKQATWEALKATHAPPSHQDLKAQALAMVPHYDSEIGTDLTKSKRPQYVP